MATQISPYTDFPTAYEACNWGNPREVADLITGEYTPIYYEDAILTKLYRDPAFWRNSAMNMWPTEAFGYGNGDLPVQEVYSPAYMKQGIQNLQNDTMPPANEVFGEDNSEVNNNCVFCYEDIPFGGFYTMKGMFVRKDYKTPALCVRQILTARLYWKYAQIILDSRTLAEETVMLDFRNLVQLYTTGHKILLEQNSPLAAANVAQTIQNEYPESYLRDQFPQVIDYEAIQPLTYRFLDRIARRMSNNYLFSDVTERTEMGPMYRLRISEDWYQGEIVENPQFTENLRHYQPSALFREAYNPDLNVYPGTVGAYKNWSFFQDSTLPRYAPDGSGGFVEVQPFITVITQNGSETVYNKDWDNAPFGVAYLDNPQAAKLMTQGDVTTNQGITIPNVQGINWEAWNEYDRECNPEKLLPFWKFHFRMGFKPWKPYMGVGILYRRRDYVVPESPNCNLYDIFCVTPEVAECDELNGPCSNRQNIPSSISQTVQGDQVSYTYQECGGARYIEVKVKFQIGRPNGLISCECGGSVRVTFSNDATRTATLLSTRWATSPLPYDTYILDLGVGGSVPTGECVTLIQCIDETPSVATIIACVGSDVCEELDANQVYIFVDAANDAWVCTSGQTVITITASNGSTTFTPVTLELVDAEAGKYLVEATGITCASGGGLVGGTIECEAP